jgi:hypothetical protein
VSARAAALTTTTHDEKTVSELIVDSAPAVIIDKVIIDQSPYLTPPERHTRVAAVLEALWDHGYVVVRAELITTPRIRAAVFAAAAGFATSTLIHTTMALLAIA